MDSMFATEKRICVALPEIGFAQNVDLDLTVQYDGRQYNLIVRALIDGGVPAISTCTGKLPMQIWGGLTAYVTSAKLSNDSGLPKGGIRAIQVSIEKDLAPKLMDWLRDTQGRILQPERPEPTFTPEPTPPETHAAPLIVSDGNILVQVDRDVSEIFGQKEGTYLVEYTLFNEPKMFRCILALHREKAIKLMDIAKPSVKEIIDLLHSDGLAMEVASYFGSSDSHLVHLMSTVLKHGFALHTRPPAPITIASEPIPEPAPAATSQDTVTLPTLKPISRQTFTVFNEGRYFEVPA